MPLKVINPKLKKKVFKSMRHWEDLAINAYEKGELKKGRGFEKKSDKLYERNYSKIFASSKKK